MRLPCRRTDFSSFLVFQLSTVAFGTSAFPLLNARVLKHSTLFSCILAVLNSPTIFLRKGFSFFQQALSNAPLYVGRWRERSYPNLKKNKKESDSGRTLKQKACLVDKEPPICSSECHLPQTGQYQRGFFSKNLVFARIARQSDNYFSDSQGVKP